MNRYQMTFATRSWSPALRPRFVRWCGPIRRYKQRADAGLMRIHVRGHETVRDKLAEGHRLLVTPNHSSHADPFTIYAAFDEVRSCCHVMATWHVFMNFSSWMQRCLQWHGCFSVDREANDLGAFRNAIDVLCTKKEPLVIFPEGEIYHCNDRVTPFREGAAAIALAAARKSSQPVAVIPTAIKYRYLTDPMPQLLDVVSKIERRILWRAQPQKPIVERLYCIAEAVLGLKELEYLGTSQSGTVTTRLRSLGETILQRLELMHEVKVNDHDHPIRVKELRKLILTQMNDRHTNDDQRLKLQHELDDLFVVMQLYSYPGDYLRTEKPTVERIAETVDKLEEDVLQRHTAGIRGKREAIVTFGEPHPVNPQKSRTAVAELTLQLQNRVQDLIDRIA